MGYECKKFCKRLRGKGGYAGGNKKCRICNIFMKVEGYFCPCCGYRLKSKPRNSRSRKRLAERTGKFEKRI